MKQSYKQEKKLHTKCCTQNTQRQKVNLDTKWHTHLIITPQCHIHNDLHKHTQWNIHYEPLTMTHTMICTHRHNTHTMIHKNKNTQKHKDTQWYTKWYTITHTYDDTHAYKIHNMSLLVCVILCVWIRVFLLLCVYSNGF